MSINSMSVSKKSRGLYFISIVVVVVLAMFLFVSIIYKNQQLVKRDSNKTVLVSAPYLMDDGDLR